MSQGPANPRDAFAGAVRLWQAGRLAEAEAALKQFVQRFGEQGDALHLLGIIAFQNGRTDAAIVLVERALKTNGASAPYHATIAKLHRAAGDLEKAVKHGARAVALKHDQPDAHYNLGLTRFDNGDPSGALESFDIALSQRPQLAEAHNGRGSVLRLQGKAREAEAAFRTAVAMQPNYVLALNNLGLVLRDRKDYDSAIAAFEKALIVAPQNADTLRYLGATYIDLDQTNPALAALQRSAAINPNKAETHNLLGRALADAGRYDEAIEALQKAIALKPDFADAQNNLGNAYYDIGRFDEALGAYDEALRLDPAMSGVYTNLVEVKKFAARDDAHLQALEIQARDNTLSDDRRSRIEFALGKAYDDLKLYDQAFEAWLKANALRRKAIAYDEPGQLGFFDRVRAIFTPELIAAKEGGGAQSQLPIFVIGMPRSGTTLVEQIIAAHPRVKGAGETRDLDLAVAAFCSGNATLPPYPELAQTLSANDLRRIGEDYVRRLSARSPGAERIVDKLPANFHFLGLIHLALPQAKVVHVVRNALDTCVSCFSKPFTVAMDHTYDLAELGRYWRAYDELMAHWRRVLPPGAFLDVQYESLVGSVESEARRIIEFLGLAWSDDVLAYQTKSTTVRTASAYQVRQPLYGSAVERWRRYEKYLWPLKAALERQ